MSRSNTIQYGLTSAKQTTLTQTKQDYAVARSLYDRIARFNGFIRYDYALD